MNSARIATLQRTVTAEPALQTGTTTRTRLRQPPRADGRFTEGGLRLEGRFKAGTPEQPLVSIVTVCRNAAATIEHTLVSVYAQTWDNLEYIVVDGASTDATPAILARHAGSIDYWVSEPDAGLYEAMNKGLALASGEFILLLNADDTYAPTAVEELMRARRAANTDFASALAAEVTPEGSVRNVMRRLPYDASVRLRMPLRHETMLVPAAVYDTVGGYDESFRISADWDFTIRAWAAGCTNYEVPRPLLMFGTEGVSSVDEAGTLAERERIVRASFPFLADEEVALLCRRQRHTGRQLLALAERHADRAELVAAIDAYVEDNTLHVRRQDMHWWADQQAEVMDALHARRVAHRPKVSVIVAVFKAEETLRACLDSVLRQTLTEFELICVNDQSPDGSQAILEEYARRDPRVVPVVNPKNIGHGATRNRGVRRARGAYIFHLDPDDTIPETALQALYERAVEHRSDLVRGAYRREQFHNGRLDAAGSEVLHPMKTPQTIVNVGIAELGELLKMPEGHWAFLYRADLARQVPYPENLKMGQDAIFLCCILPVARSITVIPDVVYHYLANAESAMNTFSMRKYLDVLEWRRRALHVLTDHGLHDFGLRLMTNFAGLGWHDQFRRHYAKAPDRAQLEQLGAALRSAYAEAGITAIPARVSPEKRVFLEHLLGGRVEPAERDLLRRAQMEAAGQSPASGRPLGTPAPQDAPAPAAAPPAAPAPVVSVILPFFRAEATIAAALDSVLSQSLRELEVVCVDDASPDGSAAIVQARAERDPRVVYRPNPANVGHGASRNAGIAAARGEFVFHLDPDDLLPPRALERLVATARRTGSDMVRGAYLHEQTLLGQQPARTQRKGLPEGAEPVVNTTLAERPQLLDHTEGHWSYLYRTEFARRVPYPTDLKMGQDSIFIVHALIAARGITLTGDLAYHYRANPDSAMNSFGHRKFLDSVEWRRRAWHALREAGHPAIGRRLLLAYWSEPFFRALDRTEGPAERRAFASALRAAFDEAGLTSADLDLARPPQRAIAALLTEAGEAAPPIVAPAGTEPALHVLTLASRDHGGAGTGTMRRVEALRARGIDVQVGTLVKRSGKPYVRTLAAPSAGRAQDPEAVWASVREKAIEPALKQPGFRAQELFSLPESVVDYRDLRPQIDAADVLHLHWVVGLFDAEHAAQTIGDKPVVWTMADMNPFTGGCHYSEGCDEYKRECRRCPLLGGQNDLAHRAWQRKKTAYAGIRALHVVCPSQWMADRVAESSLLGGRPVHVIPNAFPTDRIQPTNKLVARLRLDLPADKKLLLFGAESLANKRKGGEWLKRAIAAIAQRGTRDVEVVVFGGQTIDLPLPVHRLGTVADDRKLALVYSAADAFVFPSLEDNAPLTVGESLLCGTPVVAFRVGNTPDVIRHGETGWLAKARDVDDLVRGIDWALAADAETRLRRSIACRIAAAAYHDPRQAAERHIDLYRKVTQHA